MIMDNAELRIENEGIAYGDNFKFVGESRHRHYTLSIFNYQLHERRECLWLRRL